MEYKIRQFKAHVLNTRKDIFKKYAKKDGKATVGAATYRQNFCFSVSVVPKSMHYHDLYIL
jgi:hypothetical protein